MCLPFYNVEKAWEGDILSAEMATYRTVKIKEILALNNPRNFSPTAPALHMNQQPGPEHRPEYQMVSPALSMNPYYPPHPGALISPALMNPYYSHPGAPVSPALPMNQPPGPAHISDTTILQPGHAHSAVDTPLSDLPARYRGCWTPMVSECCSFNVTSFEPLIGRHLDSCCVLL